MIQPWQKNLKTLVKLSIENLQKNPVIRNLCNSNKITNLSENSIYTSSIDYVINVWFRK